MKQSLLVSFIEVCMSTAIGFVVSYSVWPLVSWYLGIEYSVITNLAVTGFFTVLSIARSFVVRRFFNAGLHKAAVRLAANLKEYLS